MHRAYLPGPDVRRARSTVRARARALAAPDRAEYARPVPGDRIPRPAQGFPIDNGGAQSVEVGSFHHSGRTYPSPTLHRRANHGDRNSGFQGGYSRRANASRSPAAIRDLREVRPAKPPRAGTSSISSRGNVSVPGAHQPAGMVSPSSNAGLKIRMAGAHATEQQCSESQRNPNPNRCVFAARHHPPERFT